MKASKKIISFGLAALILTQTLFVHAANVVQVPSTELDSVYYQEVQSNSIEGWAKGPQIYCESGIVMDVDSGAILYAKNIDAQHYPASITKVMTALVALENNELTDTVAFSNEDVYFLEYGDAHIGLRPGEEITMEHALYGMLLASANEVSHAIASNTEGGYDNFLRLMNEKAKELGCTNSNFMNTHGLHDPEHYVSARDMALIGSAVFKHEEFRTITATLQHTIPETNLVNEKRTFQQNHKMLYDWRQEYYEYCVGGKTGYTDQALNTLITFAQKDGVNLVAVVLRAHGGNKNSYKATREMLDYAFENFTKTPISSEMIVAEGLASIEEDAYVMLPQGITFDQLQAEVQYPTELEDKTGKIVYTYNGHPVGEVEMTIADKYYNKMHGIEEPKKEEPKPAPKVNVLLIIVKVILWLVFAAVAFYIFLLCYAVYRRKQRRKRKAEMRRRKREQEYRRYVNQVNKDE